MGTSSQGHLAAPRALAVRDQRAAGYEHGAHAEVDALALELFPGCVLRKEAAPTEGKGGNPRGTARPRRPRLRHRGCSVEGAAEPTRRVGVHPLTGGRES